MVVHVFEFLILYPLYIYMVQAPKIVHPYPRFHVGSIYLYIPFHYVGVLISL
jgi:hypothetical protein